MTKFNPDNKKVLTYGEALHPAMRITDKEDAEQHKAELVAYIRDTFWGMAEADPPVSHQNLRKNFGLLHFSLAYSIEKSYIASVNIG